MCNRAGEGGVVPFRCAMILLLVTGPQGCKAGTHFLISSCMACYTCYVLQQQSAAHGKQPTCRAWPHPTPSPEEAIDIQKRRFPDYISHHDLMASLREIDV